VVPTGGKIGATGITGVTGTVGVTGVDGAEGVTVAVVVVPVVLPAPAVDGPAVPLVAGVPLMSTDGTLTMAGGPPTGPTAGTDA
jgi:hypothetical protein